MFKSILNKVSEVVANASNVVVEKSQEAVGNSIQYVGKVVEEAPSKVEVYSKSAQLCYKVGQYEGAKQANINRGISAAMDEKIAQLNEMINAERNTISK